MLRWRGGRVWVLARGRRPAGRVWLRFACGLRLMLLLLLLLLFVAAA
jgi:hypothetical protein